MNSRKLVAFAAVAMFLVLTMSGVTRHAAASDVISAGPLDGAQITPVQGPTIDGVTHYYAAVKWSDHAAADIENFLISELGYGTPFSQSPAYRTACVRFSSPDMPNDSYCYEESQRMAETLTFNGVQGHLATIQSQDEQTAIQNGLPSTIHGGYIIGAKQTTENIGGPDPGGAAAGWTWLESEPFTYTNWLGGEPNDCGCSNSTEPVIELKSGGKWNDRRDWGLFGMIIEFDVPVPDRRVLATRYPTGSGNGSEIWTFKIDGSDETLIDNSALGSGTAQFSPDGSKIAFEQVVSFSPPSNRIVVHDTANSGGLTVIAQDTGQLSNPSWSPNGSLIAHRCANQTAICISKADGSGSVANPLFTASQVGLSHIGSQYWSPDGETMLVGVSGPDPFQSRLFVLDITDPSGTPTATFRDWFLSDSDNDAVIAAWSDDGSRLLVGLGKPADQLQAGDLPPRAEAFEYDGGTFTSLGVIPNLPPTDIGYIPGGFLDPDRVVLSTSGPGAQYSGREVHLIDIDGTDLATISSPHLQVATDIEAVLPAVSGPQEIDEGDEWQGTVTFDSPAPAPAQVAFYWQNGGNPWSNYSYELGSGTVLTDLQEQGTTGKYSWDGTKFVFQDDYFAGGNSIEIMDSDSPGTSQTLVIGNPPTGHGAPSPDNSEVAFRCKNVWICVVEVPASFSGWTPIDLRSMSLTDIDAHPGIRRLVDITSAQDPWGVSPDTGVGRLAYGPVGNVLAFEGSRGASPIGPWIWTIEASAPATGNFRPGSDAVPLVSPGVDCSGTPLVSPFHIAGPDWSVDGGSIAAVLDTAEIWEFDLSAGTASCLTDGLVNTRIVGYPNETELVVWTDVDEEVYRVKRDGSGFARDSFLNPTPGVLNGTKVAWSLAPEISTEVIVDWDDGSTTTYSNAVSPLAISHDYLDDNPTGTPSDDYLIEVTVRTGGSDEVTTFSLTVNNVDPVVSPQVSASTINEGESVDLDVTFTDVGVQDTHSAVIDWGDTSPDTTLPSVVSPFSESHTYAEYGQYAIDVTVTDDDTGSTTEQVSVVVNDVPDVTIDPDSATVEQGDSFDAEVTFVDNDSTTWSAVIDWGDSSPDTVLPSVSSPFNISHVYTELGNRVVMVTVTDDLGASGQDTANITVIVPITEIVLFNDRDGDGIDPGDILDSPHRLQISGVGDFVSGDEVLEDELPANCRLHRGSVYGAWRTCDPAADDGTDDETLELEFATVDIVLYNDRDNDGIDESDKLTDPHKVQVSNVGDFTTGDEFHVPPTANISYRLHRGSVYGAWNGPTSGDPINFPAGDSVWELEFAAVDIVLYNDRDNDGIDESDKLTDPHKVQVSNVGDFTTGDEFHVPPTANISYRLHRGSVYGAWNGPTDGDPINFPAGDSVWELEFATVEVLLYNDRDGNGAVSSVPDMGYVRAFEEAVTLDDGKVLVTGGVNHLGPPYSDASNPLRTAELFDPAANNWTAVADMQENRQNHRMALLENGKVLVAGGSDESLHLNSAEVYNPADNTWTSTGPMTSRRAFFGFTRLNDGRVLATGGHNGSVDITSAEIYDPVSNSWSPAGSTAANQGVVTSTLLRDGRVLVTGGTRSTSVYDEAEIWDSVSGWTPVAPLPIELGVHTAVLLPDLWPTDRVLVAGGLTTGLAPSANAYIYDVGANTWTEMAPMSVARFSHEMALLPDGRVVVIGGVANQSTSEATDVVEVYDPASDTWSVFGNLSQARGNAASAQLDDNRILIAGGSSMTTAFSSAELVGVVIDESDKLYDPHRVQVSNVGDFTTGDEFHVPPTANISYRLHRGSVYGAWNGPTDGDPINFPAGDTVWALEFATVDVVLYNDRDNDGIDESDKLTDPHKVQVSNVGDFTTGDEFHVPPTANISYRLHRGSVYGVWNGPTDGDPINFPAGDSVWELEFATVEVLLYNDHADDGIDESDKLYDPHRVQVSNVGDFTTGDEFHVPPTANISYRLHRGSVYGVWNGPTGGPVNFPAGDTVWELEFATVTFTFDLPPAMLDQFSTQVSNVATLAHGDTVHLPPNANISFRVRSGGWSQGWVTHVFGPGECTVNWDLVDGVTYSGTGCTP